MAEKRNVEYQREFNDTTLRAIVAYANTDGGRIYVGIDEFGRTYGVQNAQEIAERITTLAQNLVRPDVSSSVVSRVEKRDGRDVVVTNVFRGESRPYWLAEKGLCPQGVPVAENGRVVTPSERKLRQMLAETGSGAFERERSRVQTLTFDQSSKIFGEEKLTLSEKSFREFGLVDESGTYTNLALLLSDQCPATIRLAFFEGARENQIHDRLELSGSILRQYRDAFDFLDQYNRTNETLRAANRGDFHDYPSEILREALVNAIVHRDYRTDARTLIRHYHNRVEIVSPGGVPRELSLDELNLGVSAPRNPGLVNIFYQLEYVESCGTGIRKIRQAYAACRFPPRFETSPHYFKTTLYNASRQKQEKRVADAVATVATPPLTTRVVRMESPAPVKPPESAPLVVVTPTPEPVQDPPRSRRMTTIRDSLSVASPTLATPATTVRQSLLLSSRERLTLQMLKTRETITRADVERELNLTQAAAAAILRRLVNAGRVVLCGAGSNIWYRLP